MQTKQGKSDVLYTRTGTTFVHSERVNHRILVFSCLKVQVVFMSDIIGVPLQKNETIGVMSLNLITF